jgi:hypothetical protein
MAIQDRRAALRFQWQPRRVCASIRCAAALAWAPRSSGRRLGRAAPRQPPPPFAPRGRPLANLYPPDAYKKIGPFSSGVAVCVWANQASGEAAPRTFHTVTISPRRYLDRDTNQWKDASSFHPSDLPGLIYALQVALKFCFETSSSEGEPHQSEGDATVGDPPDDDIPF